MVAKLMTINFFRAVVIKRELLVFCTLSLFVEFQRIGQGIVLSEDVMVPILLNLGIFYPEAVVYIG
jgi:hypothetical protein